MALTSEGLTIKPFTEILEDLNDGLTSRVGELDTSENSFIGHLHSNIAYSISELYELSQGIYDSQNLFNAEGEGLENLAIQVGLVRLPPTRTAGTAYFTGAEGTIIPQDTTSASVRGDLFLNPAEFQISTTNCLEARIYINTLIEAVPYRVRIGGQTGEYLSQVGDTIDDVLQGLLAQLSTDISTNTYIQDLEDPENSYISIVKDDKNTTMSLSSTTYISFDWVQTPANIASQETGLIAGDKAAINTIVDNVTGWYEVSNPDDFILGSPEETDAELRQRIVSDFNNVGSGTVDSIGTNINSVPNVAASRVIENDTHLVDGDGRPPKSYEVVIHQGLTEDIAPVLWRTKPAGIYQHGNVEATIQDYNGFDRIVRFSRPTVQFAYVHITYELFDEEIFPISGEEDIALAIVQEAQLNLSIGDDIVVKRFTGNIYNTVAGVGNVTIEMAIVPDTNVPPSYPADYVTDLISITQEEITSFATDRITYTVV